MQSEITEFELIKYKVIKFYLSGQKGTKVCKTNLNLMIKIHLNIEVCDHTSWKKKRA